MLEGTVSPYDSVTLQIISINKDFTAKKSSSVSFDTVDEEFLTYPTAVNVFEDTDFIRFYNGKSELPEQK